MPEPAVTTSSNGQLQGLFGAIGLTLLIMVPLTSFSLHKIDEGYTVPYMSN